MLMVVTPEEISQMDQKSIREYGIPGIVLMENAAIRVVSRIQELFRGRNGLRVGILCGRGNNGGDGLAIARHLYQQGHNVKVGLLASPEKVSGDAHINLSIVQKLSIPLSCITDEEQWLLWEKEAGEMDLIIDALLGTGLSKEVTGLYKKAIEWINESNAFVLSVDIPSGIDGKNGKRMGTAVYAKETVTFAYPKLGHFLYPGREHTGNLVTEEIGIPRTAVKDTGMEVLQDEDVKSFLPPRRRNTHKGTYGKVAVIAGSKGLVGAGALAASAALRSGAGLVTLGVPDSLMGVYQTKLTEIMTYGISDEEGSIYEGSWESVKELLAGKDCLVIGPGLGKNSGIFQILRNILEEYDIPIVIDADGINHICQDINILRKTRGEVILTPHPGEMARLLNSSLSEIIDDPLGTAVRFAVDNGVSIVLKGSTTVIADSRGRVTLNITGNPGMATGGSGDVLAGMIAGLLAQGLGAYDAARVGCYLHGRAGDAAAEVKGEYGMTAGDLIDFLPKVLKIITER